MAGARHGESSKNTVPHDDAIFLADIKISRNGVPDRAANGSAANGATRYAALSTVHQSDVEKQVSIGQGRSDVRDRLRLLHMREQATVIEE